MVKNAASKKSNGAAARATANNPEDEVSDTNERILLKIHNAYMHTEGTDGPPLLGIEPKVKPEDLKPGVEGIMSICSKIGLSCIAPRRKINVMIVGNHSAGKSSYINWYAGEHIQRAAVAIETQGFTFVTSGKKRDTLKGHATLKLFPHLNLELEQFAPSIYNGVQTEVSTSIEKLFKFVTFIDTPGLVDGSFQYPFPVEDAILAVAKHTDLIYIFFDPIGQALCDRTMKVIERLNENHADKLRYFLSKADTVSNERDRQKVVVQITQNLSSRVRNAHAFELPSLYIPDHVGEKGCKVDNAIEHTCEEMEQAINQAVQNNLNKMEDDCKLVSQTIDDLLAKDKLARKYNLKAAGYGYLFLLASFPVPLFLIFFFLHQLDSTWWKTTSRAYMPEFVAGLESTCDWLVKGDEGLLSTPQFFGIFVGIYLFLLLASKIARRYEPYFSRATTKKLEATRAYVLEELIEKKQKLYGEYLSECSSELQ